VQPRIEQSCATRLVAPYPSRVGVPFSGCCSLRGRPGRGISNPEAPTTAPQFHRHAFIISGSTLWPASCAG
jgi:hypothetical protein